MEKIVGLALIESPHKRIAYLKGDNFVTIVDYPKSTKSLL
jgi:hypothetical protein